MQVCLPAGCIDAIRVALVDECTDVPVPGASNGYIFNCFRNADLTTNVEEGEETVLRNDCGRKCFATRKCDELTNVGFSFELLNPDYELTNLLTGQSLINDGLENIGWFHTDGQTCSPWLSVELFERVPDEQCIPGHVYRRIVIPKMRFRPVPTPQREGQMRVVAFEGVSSPASLAAWGTGPFFDSPFDFGDLAPTIQSHIMEFFDNSIDETLAGSCGFIPIFDNNNLAAAWSGQNELTISDNEGSTELCDADEIVITLEGGGTVTIPLPDPNVTVTADCKIIIANMDTYNPTGLPIDDVDIRDDNGDTIGDYDSSRGLPPGQKAVIPPTPDFIADLFPDVDPNGGHILMGSDSEDGGCRYMNLWYDCETDVMSAAFNNKNLYGGDVFRTEIVTNLGTFDVPVINEWREVAFAWSIGSTMQIENASSYGLDWATLRTYDDTDTLMCEWHDPVFTWHGGPWLLDQSRCITIPPDDPTVPGGGLPIINNVVVEA